jgi:hypothetical protein
VIGRVGVAVVGVLVVGRACVAAGGVAGQLPVGRVLAAAWGKSGPSGSPRLGTWPTADAGSLWKEGSPRGSADRQRPLPMMGILMSHGWGPQIRDARIVQRPRASQQLNLSRGDGRPRGQRSTSPHLLQLWSGRSRPTLSRVK